MFLSELSDSCKWVCGDYNGAFGGGTVPEASAVSKPIRVRNQKKRRFCGSLSLTFGKHDAKDYN